MSTKYEDHNKERGFSLVELLVTVLVFSFVMVAIYGLFDQGNWMYLHSERRSGIQDMARIAMEQMERDLRMIGAACPASVSTSGTTWVPFVKGATRSSIAFVGDIDNGNTRLAGDAAATTTVENPDQACPVANTAAVLTDEMKTWGPITCGPSSPTAVTVTGSFTCPAAECFITTPEKISYRLRNSANTGDGDTDNDGVCDETVVPFCILQRAEKASNDPDAVLADSDYKTMASNIKTLQFTYRNTLGTDLGANPTGGSLFAIGKISVLMIATDRGRMYDDKDDSANPRTQDFNLNTEILVRNIRY